MQTETELGSEDKLFDVQDLLPFDLRLVPELQEVDQELLRAGQSEQVEKIFQSQDGPNLGLDEGQVKINNITLYGFDIQESKQRRASASAQTGILLINVAISNFSDKDLYIPENFLRLKFDGENEFAPDDSTAYPLDFGYLEKILDKNQRRLQAEQTVEGYLVYHLSALNLLEAKHQGYLALSVQNWIRLLDRNPQEIALLQSDAKDFSMVLPVNQEVAEHILQNQDFIQDRLSQEWWGDKLLISRFQGPENLQTGAVNIQLSKMELCDFDLRPEYRQLFQEFPQGQIILTVELLLENDKDSIYLLRPQDIALTLNLANQQFKTEDSLIKENLPKYLGPNQSQRIRRVFVIDKAFYQQNGQGKALELGIQLPVKGYGRLPLLHRLVPGLATAFEQDNQLAELALADKFSLQANYHWHVKTDILFDEQLKLIHE